MALTKKTATDEHTEVKPAKPKKTSTKLPAIQGELNLNAKKSNASSATTETRKSTNTQIVIKCDVGFHNHVTIRGNGANLSWEKGQPLKNVKHDEWLWETDAPFANAEFKVLLNDKTYEQGNNHHLKCGSQLEYTPHF